jgi:hypothetical protein
LAHGDYALALRANGSSFLRCEDTQPLSFGEIVFVLPAPRTVGVDDDVECVIHGLDPRRCFDDRLPQLDVSTPKRPGLVPEQPNRMRVTPTRKGENMVKTPDVRPGGVTAHPPVEIPPVSVSAHPDALRARRKVKHEALAIVGDDTMREGPPDPSFEHAPKFDDLAGTH